jgi:hypothetical protein
VDSQITETLGSLKPMSKRNFDVNLFGELPPPPHPVRRSRITNDPTSRANQDTAAGRRLADMIRGFLAEMGNPRSPVAQADAIRAAELTVAAENARAKLLKGDGDGNAVVRLENLATRAVRKLGLADRQNAAKSTSSVADYMREKAAQKAKNTTGAAA